MLSLVIPIYKSEANLPTLLPALGVLSQRLGGQMEVVFVVDGSPDQSWATLTAGAPKLGFSNQVLLLSRNFGAFSAVRAGLAAGRGEIFAVVAADMQEPPELIEQFRERLVSGDYDVAIGVRTERKDSFFSRVSSSLFWAMYRRFIVRDIPPGGVDVFGCTRAFRDRLLAFEELNTSLIALIFWLGYRRALVPYQRAERKAGKSSWTLAKKFRYLSDSIYAFSDLPLRALTLIGTVGVLLATGLGCVVLWGRIQGTITVPGYSTAVILTMFFGGLNSLGLGIVGGYLWRTYENTKRRPLYHVMSRQVDGKAS